MAEKIDNRPDCVVTGNYNGQFRSVLLRGTKDRREARAYGERKGWTYVRVIQAVALAAGIFAGVVADRAHAAEISDAKQYAMVLTATEIMETAQCGTAEKSISQARLTENGIDVRGRDSQAFLTTVEAIAQIYVADPKGFCRRAFLAAGR